MNLEDFVLDPKLQKDINHIPTYEAPDRSEKAKQLEELLPEKDEDNPAPKPQPKPKATADLVEMSEDEIPEDEGWETDRSAPNHDGRRKVLAKQWTQIYNQLQGATSVYLYKYFVFPVVKQERIHFLTARMQNGQLSQDEQKELATLQQELASYHRNFDEFSNSAYIDKDGVDMLSETIAEIMQVEGYEPGIGLLIGTAMAGQPIVNASRIIAAAMK